MRLTKRGVDKLPVPKPVPPARKAQALYRDDDLKGFAVRVTSGGVKTFVVEKRIKGRVRRISLGRYGELTAEEARKQAQKLLGQIATGIDPVAERRRKQALTITLEEVFQDYLLARKTLKPRTVADYRQVMYEAFPEWLPRPLASINKDMVAKRHREHGERSPARADNAMRVLSALFNFAAGQYEDDEGHSFFAENPVKRLSHTRAWYRVPRRRTVIGMGQLPAWFEAVMKLGREHTAGNAKAVSDYLLLLLFTGLRRSEAATLTWRQVDFVGRTLSIPDTKNREPHVLPLSDFVYNRLKERRKGAESTYVFPGEGKAGYLQEPRRMMARVTAASRVAFTLHDLRRTFITAAESLDIPAYALKRLLNHKVHGDVTAGYIVSDVERLREPMERVSAFLLRAAKVTPSADVTVLKHRGTGQL